MDPIIVVFCAIVALLIGGGLGYFLGGRPVAEWKQRHGERDAEAKELDAKYLRAFADLEAARETAARAGELELQRDAARDQREALGAELATFKANAANFDEQKRLVIEAREEMLKEFQLTGSKVLGKAQEDFLKAAGERFGHAETANKEAVANLLKPVDERLAAYERSVKEMEADRKKDYGNISGLMEQVRLGQEAVKVEASNIVSSLRAGPKTSGRWGEQQFKNLIELAGLSEFTDFRSEVSVKSDDGILRPDFVISLPGNRELIVDIKCPLNSYLSATEQQHPSDRLDGFKSFSNAVQGHANALSKKSYWTQFKKSPDFVILYIPGDNFLTAALEHAPKMWEDAARNRVIISGPATFLPLARTIASMWDQEKLTDKAEEILELGRDLHENLSIMTSRIRRLGDDIGKTARSYNEFVTSIDGKVILRARRFEELNLTKSEKRLGDLSVSEEQLRPIQRLADSEN